MGGARPDRDGRHRRADRRAGADRASGPGPPCNPTSRRWCAPSPSRPPSSPRMARSRAPTTPGASSAGPRRRLGLGDAPALLRAAARDGQASQETVLAGATRRLDAARLDGGRFLVRLAAAPPPVEPVDKPLALAPAAIPVGLDPFAAASPFGAAHHRGRRPVRRDHPGGERGLGRHRRRAGLAGRNAGRPPHRRQPRRGRPAPRGRRRRAVRGDAESQAGQHRPPLRLAPGRPRGRLSGGRHRAEADAGRSSPSRTRCRRSASWPAASRTTSTTCSPRIRLSLDELMLRHPLGDPSYEGLSRSARPRLRAADLVGQLLTFSRKATMQRETLDLGELISNVEVLLRRLLRENVGWTPTTAATCRRCAPTSRSSRTR